ncbi:hypothetical protein [Bdellovibrio bacteriovorus]|uniref:hypothetical protein n=1 Tax=Bdellovibrio TaxID=958 RepID=UPI0035A8F0C2
MTFYRSKIYVLIFSALVSLPASADEGMMLEGSVGTSQVTMHSPQDAETELSGNTAFLRLHFPLYQSANQFFNLTVSNQFLHSSHEFPDTGQKQILGQSAFGIGLSYRLSYLIVGAEYQQATFEQITVGPQTTENIFYMGNPHFYGGLIYKFGRLGLGAIYSLKKFDIPTEKSELSSQRPYEEKNILLTITYHFEGGTGSFLRSLFSRK